MLDDGFLSYDGNHAPKGPFVLNKDSPQSRSLVGWWPLVNQGSTFKDLSGFNKHGTSAAVLSYTRTAYGNLAYQSAAAKDVSAPAVPQMSAIAGYSMSCWAEATTAVNGIAFCIKVGTTSGNNLLAFYPYYAGTDTGFHVYHRGLNSGPSGAIDRVGTGPHLFTFVQPVSGNCIAYVDGVEEWNSSTVGISPALDAVQFGHWKGTQDYTGRAWDFRLYDRALSLNEVRSAYAPQTRWDLYYDPGKITYFMPGTGTIPTGGIINTNMVGSSGRLAGIGGGLAA